MISSGDNFFKTATYTIEALCVGSYEDTTHKLREIEAQILRKRNELRQFETEYRKVWILTFLAGLVIGFGHIVNYLDFILCRHWHAFKK